MLTTNKIRRRAAEILKRGQGAWCQKEFRKQNPDGTYAYCLIGACREAVGYYAAYAAARAAAADYAAARAAAADYAAAAVAAAADAAAAARAAAADAAAAAAYDAAAAAYDADADAAAAWNDTPGRTREEVIAALEKGI